jgi:uncharacterized membrane protein (DUF485 family)
MQLTKDRTNSKSRYVAIAKSFLIWCFALTVTLLVVGFPLVVLMATVGALLSITLHPILPVSAVLLVAGGLIAFNILAVVVGAAMLTLKGIHPHEVRWLSWLHGDAQPISSTTYAACPLTCEIDG